MTSFTRDMYANEQIWSTRLERDDKLEFEYNKDRNGYSPPIYREKNKQISNKPF